MKLLFLVIVMAASALASGHSLANVHVVRISVPTVRASVQSSPPATCPWTVDRRDRMVCEVQAFVGGGTGAPSPQSEPSPAASSARTNP